jgi:pyruvate dehydrogenase complex dehydrogenase (E1) component
MKDKTPADQQSVDPNELETREWLDSLDYVIQRGGQDQVQGLLEKLCSFNHPQCD